VLEIPQFVIDRGKSDQPFFAADEVGCWSEGLLQQLLETEVLTPGPNAKSISCNACRDDHFEDVQFLKSPSGSGLRAYIPCPESGRVQVPLERLKRWQVNLAKAIAFARGNGGRTDIRTVHLHYEAGHGAYICIIDELKRPFDFVTSRFQRIDELEKAEQACLIATGRADSRAGFGFSYTVSFDVYQLVANIPDSSIPPDGLTFSIRWLIQKGKSPSPKNDTVLLDSARIRFLNGQFSSVDTSSQEMFDEDIAFAKRQRWAEEKKEFREQELDKHEELSRQLGKALTAGDVAETLRVLAESIAFWAKGLKKHLVDHFYFDVQDPFFCRVYQTPPDASFQFVPFWLTQPWIGMQEVYDLLEFHKSTEIAKAFSTRMDALIEARDKFIYQVVESTRRFEWRIDFESFVFLDEQRKDLRNRAIAVCEYLALIATQFDAARPEIATPIDDPLSERAQAMLVAMIEMNAVDSDRRQTTENIVARALGATASPNAVKEVMAELNARQFVNSKQGRGGGIWLTEKGRDRANKLRDR